MFQGFQVVLRFVFVFFHSRSHMVVGWLLPPLAGLARTGNPTHRLKPYLIREGTHGWLRGNGRAARPGSPDLLDILDLLDFVFDLFHYSKSGVEIEDLHPGGWSWLLPGFWRL
jgi:hypothetical protein